MYYTKSIIIKKRNLHVYCRAVVNGGHHLVGREKDILLCHLHMRFTHISPFPRGISYYLGSILKEISFHRLSPPNNDKNDILMFTEFGKLHY